jgi:hypothetical protein
MTRGGSIVVVGLAMGSAAAVLFALLEVGAWSRHALAERDRYLLPFDEIECLSPPGMERSLFLAEVRYLAEHPERIRLLDAGAAGRLADAFAKHRWVARVEQVEIGPGRRVGVRLTFRRPVLAVRVEGMLRVVDSEGVLLPASALAEGLPIFEGEPPPPSGPAGTRYGDAAVEAAARRAGRERDKHP